MKRSATSTHLGEERWQVMKKSASVVHLPEVPVQVVTKHHLVLLHSDISALLPLRGTPSSPPPSPPTSACSSPTSPTPSPSPQSPSLWPPSPPYPPLLLPGLRLDIPHLYRRTNREAPSKPCTYVTAIANILADFSSHPSTLGTSSTTTLVTWLGQAADIILLAYQEQVLAGFLTKHY